MKTIPLAQDPLTADHRWRWHRLLWAPHRLAFLAGAFVLGASALWWAAALLARAQGVAWPWTVAPAFAHSLLMGYGFVPMFFAGFMFTAGPKWLGQPPVQAGALRVTVIAHVTGWLLFIAGVHLHVMLAAAGVALAAGAFANVTLRFARIVAASAVPDQVHARLVLAGCALGTVALFAATCGLAFEQAEWLRAAVHGGLWACIALVFVAVIHRMVPFFSAAAVPALDAWRPLWLLWTLVAAVSFEALGALADVIAWPLPAPWRAAQASVETAIAALLLWLAVRWGLVQSLKIRLLAMLHVGFVWLGLAFALNAVSHTMMAAGGPAHSLGLAPMHALTAGFFGSTLLAMVTRVSAGHGGRPVAADDIVWRLFWLLQVAVAARVAASLWDAAAGALLPVAALAWAAAMAAWAMRYGRWYGTPRKDGRPG
jgi:uncharacterized protein involved in response to NO